MTEVAKHSTPESCWTVVEGKVYDVTAFLKEHPGGERAVLALAGVDASEAFVAMHPPMLRPRLERFRIGHVEVRADRGGEGGKSKRADGLERCLCCLQVLTAPPCCALLPVVCAVLCAPFN